MVRTRRPQPPPQLVAIILELTIRTRDRLKTYSPSQRSADRQRRQLREPERGLADTTGRDHGGDAAPAERVAQQPASRRWQCGIIASIPFAERLADARAAHRGSLLECSLLLPASSQSLTSALSGGPVQPSRPSRHGLVVVCKMTTSRLRRARPPSTRSLPVESVTIG